MPLVVTLVGLFDDKRLIMSYRNNLLLENIQIVEHVSAGSAFPITEALFPQRKRFSHNGSAFPITEALFP